MSTHADQRPSLPDRPLSTQASPDASVAASPERPLERLPEQLLGELARVTDLVRASTHKNQEALMAVIRLVPGLDLPHWQSISAQCDGWFALPLGDTKTQDGTACHTPAEDGRDAVTGMWQTASFGTRLNTEVEHARHEHRALALILFEEGGLETLPPRDAVSALRALSSHLWEASAGTDLLGRLQPGVLALALPACGRFQALAVAEHVVQETEHDLSVQHLACSVRAGLACLDEKSGRAGGSEGKAKDESDRPDELLLEQARQALSQAACLPGASVQDRVRLFRVDETPHERETLVLASEKHFLFFGGAQ